MSNVDDLDLDVDLDDVEVGGLIAKGRYLQSITDMSIKETSAGQCFLFKVEMLDTMEESNLKFIGKTVNEIINVSRERADGSENKQLKRLKGLLGGAFGIDKPGSKIPGWIKNKPFTAYVSIDDYDPENERNATGSWKSAEGWDGIEYMMDGEELVKKDEPAPAKANGKASSKPAARANKGRVADSDEVEL
jgi:hypothetical protein